MTAESGRARVAADRHGRRAGPGPVDPPQRRRRGVAMVLSLTIATLAPAAMAAETCGTGEPPGSERERRFVDAMLGRMTLEEKFGQLNQVRGRHTLTGPRVPVGGEDRIRAGEVGSLLNVLGADYTRGLQRIAVEETRLGIPLLFAYDVIHGFRTLFPVGIGEAASFDVAAVEGAARIAAVEAAASGIHWTYAPMVDVARDPRWGRVVESAGEDPFLGAALAAARVRGFQGEDLGADDTVLATAKHFVAYGGAEGGRDYGTVDMSERTLHDVHLPPFKAAVDAGVQSIMPAFNEVAGVPMHADRGLLQGVLRDRWGFDGVVVSDYNGIAELITHGVAHDRTEAGLLALRAGVDVDMVSGVYVDDLPRAVRSGRLPQAQVDTAVRRVLQAKCRLGLFADPYRYNDAAREQARTLTAAHREAARALARKSLVLLKNDGDVLPLSKDLRTLAVIGPLADDARAVLGSWALAGRTSDAVTPLAGIRAAVGPRTRVLHTAGVGVHGGDRAGFDEALRMARQADAVVMFLGEDPGMSGEANNRSTLDLPGLQEELALAVQATGKPLAVVLLHGRPLSIGALDAQVPAILAAWYPGTEAGHAIADVLFGDHGPSGKLPITFPRNVGQVPVYHAHKHTGRPPTEESKYSSKYLDVPWTPLYAFGHGLGYTTFRYAPPRLQHARIGIDGSQRVEVEVTNTGRRAGDEVVQLYLRDEVGSVTRPVKELRGFRRIHLQPGETGTVAFTLTPDDLAFHGADMRRRVEPGRFAVFVGGNSVDLQEALFEVVAE